MTMTYQEAAETGLLAELERRDELDGPGPRLWDADPDVCCAAFQLGACCHTEAMDEESIEEAEAAWRADCPEEAAEADRIHEEWLAERDARLAADDDVEPF